MSITVSNLAAAGTLCCTLLTGAYGLVVSPLKHEVAKQQLVVEQLKEHSGAVRINTDTLQKQDIRIEQNRKQIQLQEISAAKREVQMDHLTEAIRQLNELLKEMNEEK